MVLRNITPARTLVLELSLELEKRANAYLSYILGIEDYKLSASFGYKSSNMPFNFKVQLLMDMKVIVKDEKELVIDFMSIRNKFMHDLDCRTFEDVFKQLNNISAEMLIKKYTPVEKIKSFIKSNSVLYEEPLDEVAYNRDIPLEEQLTYCIEKMGVEAERILEKAVAHHLQNLVGKMEAAKTERRMAMFADMIYQYDTTITQKAEHLEAGNQSISGAELKKFTSEVMHKIFTDIQESEKQISDGARKEFGF